MGSFVLAQTLAEGLDYMLGLDSLAPRFLVPSKRIRVLYEPNEFYTYLCNRIRTAKSRVFLASLYLGKSESELVGVLAESLQRNDQLRVYVLVDALRGTREAPAPCSASLLAPLAAKFPHRVHLSMYRTPKLSRIAAALLPKRIIEGAGLQHMKIYGWDDEVMLSGANLSQDYFTNRQDRYILINDRKVADHYFKVHSEVSKLSSRLLPADNESGFTLTKPDRAAISQAKRDLSALMAPMHSDKPRATADDTEVYPVCQLTPLGIGNELAVMRQITAAASSSPANSSPANSSPAKYSTAHPTAIHSSGLTETTPTITSATEPWLFTAGYFNVEPELGRRLAASTVPGQVIVAAPEANGFFQSRGVSGRIPGFYSYFAEKFMRSLPPGSPVSMREWRKGVVNTPGGWSYHAKGLWLDHAGRIVTYIGSSNFTRRSYRHDIECGAVLVAPDTNNTAGEQIRREKSHLLENCQSVQSDTKTQLTLSERLFLCIFGDRL